MALTNTKPGKRYGVTVTTQYGASMECYGSSLKVALARAGASLSSALAEENKAGRVLRVTLDITERPARARRVDGDGPEGLKRLFR